MSKRSLSVVTGLGLGLVVFAALAATAPTAFEFKFDAKGDIENWVANEGSKAEWKAGGAEGSAGCLKLTGSHCSADSGIVDYKAADNAVAFDYFVHAADSLRMRVSVVGDEAVKKYGRYGNYFVRNPEQDKWVHAEVKLIDLPGMAEEMKAKATPDLQYNRVGFSTISAAGDDAYLLIDNVRLVKAGEKAAPTTKKAE